MLAKLIEFTRAIIRGTKASIAKVDLGGGHTALVQHYAPVGDDSQPLPGDYLILTPLGQTGKYAGVGYANPDDDQTSEPGDKRIYARDSSGAQVSEIWLKNTGEIVATNGAATITVTAGGDITVTGGTMTVTADLDITGNVTLAGNILQTGNLTLTGNYISVGTMLNNGFNVGNTHGHTQGNDLGGDVEAPIVGVT